MDPLFKEDAAKGSGARKVLDTSVAISMDEGVITVFSLIEHPPSSKKRFDILYPEVLDFVVAVDLAKRLRGIGRPIGAVDCLIASMCLNRSSQLITRDKDFLSIKNVVEGFNLKII